MRSWTFISALIFLLLLSPVSLGLKLVSGDTVYIDSPVRDDVIAAGSIVSVDAPVESLIVAGGTVAVNAPVAGDVIALGGQVFLNSQVGGKVVAAAGSIKVRGDIDRNALLAAGPVDIERNVTVGGDALIFADRVTNAGKISGTLNVSASSLNNTGSAGRMEFHQIQYDRDRAKPKEAFGAFWLIVTLGFLIAGLVLLKFYPGTFEALDIQIRGKPIVETIVGFIGIFVTLVVMILLMITMVGIPLSLMTLIFLAGSMLLAHLFVAFSLGRSLTSMVGRFEGNAACFTVGFVILNILFMIPLVGWLISLLASSLGYGAIIFALVEKARA